MKTHLDIKDTITTNKLTFTTFQTRYCSLKICRWISTDKLEYLTTNSIIGLNLYAYCNNNPIMNYDPSGAIAVGTIITCIVLFVLTLFGLVSDTPVEQYEEPIPEDAKTCPLASERYIYYKISLNDEDENKTSLKIYNSFHYSEKEIEKFLNYLKFEEGYSPINIDKVRNEWGWHKLAYEIKFRQTSIASADIYFNHDDEDHGAFSFIMNNFKIF